MKICSVCGKEKKLDDFYNRKSSKDGKRSDCIECNKKKTRENYKDNAEKRRQDKNIYYYKNRDIILERARKAYKEDENKRKKAIENADKWAKENPEKRAAIANRYYEKTKEQKAEYGKRYYQQNKVRLRPIRAEAKRKRMKSDVNYKLACTMREKTCKAIRYGYKHKPTLELLGCTIEELKQHLEELFEEGMTWDNWGVNGWHIDHILPVASFDLTKEEEQKKCFHYTNLQPLCAKKNRTKQGKVMV